MRAERGKQGLRAGQARLQVADGLALSLDLSHETRVGCTETLPCVRCVQQMRARASMSSLEVLRRLTVDVWPSSSSCAAARAVERSCRWDSRCAWAKLWK